MRLEQIKSLPNIRRPIYQDVKTNATIGKGPRFLIILIQALFMLNMPATVSKTLVSINHIALSK